MRKTSVSRKIFVVFNTIFLCTLALLCFLPLLNLFAISLSGKAAANSGRVTFWPIDFTVMAYQKTFQNNNFVRSLMISFARTIVGTAVSMGVITMAGYALSRDFKGRTAIMWFFVFTMLFGGGLIPSYLVNSSLGLKNSFWVYILPGAFSCYNMILIMNFFRTIPKALEEAARMDGANIFQQMWYVELPAIKNIIVIQFILQAGNIMSIGFEKAYALQTDMNLPASEILSTYVYRIGLLNGDYGYSTAVGLFNSVINVILLIIVNAVVKKLNDGEGI